VYVFEVNALQKSVLIEQLSRTMERVENAKPCRGKPNFLPQKIMGPTYKPDMAASYQIHYFQTRIFTLLWEGCKAL